MGRTHIIQHWSDAAEYSGEMIGNRLASSSELHMIRGKANIALYADESPKRKPRRSVRDKLVPQQVRLNNIEKYMRELEEEYDNGEISTEEYIQLYRIAEQKHKRAYELLAKAYGWSDSEPLAQHEEPIEQINYTSYDENPIVSSTAQEIFSSLSDGNVFKIAYMKIKRIAEALK